VGGGKIWTTHREKTMLTVLNWIYSVTGLSPLTCAAVIVGLLVAVLYFKIIFGGFGEFRQDVRNNAKIPLLHRDFDHVESQWSRSKILIWILLSIGCGVLAYYRLPGWLPSLFPRT
jgi:hypothetical protein